MTDTELPLVTVILVTANRSHELDALIRSLQDQTMANWELIAMDCASTDNTLERLEAWQQDDSRVRVYTVEETDRAIGRRQALQKARGEFVAWMDPHTTWPADFLESLLTAFTGAQEAERAVYAHAHVLDAEGSVDRALPGELRHGTMIRDLFNGAQIPLTAFLVRRRVVRPLEKTGMRFTLGNDHALLLWLAYQTPFGYANTSVAPVEIRPIDGVLPPGLDPVSEARGEAMTHALEHLPGAIPSRFARRCLATFHCRRAEALCAAGDSGDALNSAFRALMYRPLWPGAWKQLFSVAVRG